MACFLLEGWSDPDRGTKWFHPKSEDSLGDVEVDGEVMELFRGYPAKVTRTFVVESKVSYPETGSYVRTLSVRVAL